MSAFSEPLLEQIARRLGEFNYALGQFYDDQPGMRDQFAMAAMQGELAAQAGPEGVDLLMDLDDELDVRAQFYYRMADAMMRMRDEE